ncbi:DUF4157 domain-containing protein [Nostoc sp. FACHB-133]|uniref:eCIS core domain-containing protein n=1 Tax=Nostoc sp. FACHB-133 TaxID=2692835 RepID=UPI0018F023E4|nr:DUF4157 domain-containing protein [Nostoc sp. FACHB-133]
MREHVSRQKKTTTDFSIPSLKHATRGFGLESSAISRQAVPEIQPLHKPVTHDISRIPLRSQAKLSISQPGDIYEQEADSVAQQVMQRMAQPVNHQSIQREALPQEEKELQMKPLANSITPLVQREALPDDEEELQMKSLDNSTLQREALPEDEEELQMKPMVQRQAKAGMDAAPDLEASINQARGGGVAIADNIREPMEQAFGADFSGVKVHTDGQSDQLNRSIQARAFTTGQDVFFRSGEYNPGSRGGQELLAHELTHVVQQNGGAVQRSLFNTLQPPSPSVQQHQVIQRARKISAVLNVIDQNRDALGEVGGAHTKRLMYWNDTGHFDDEKGGRLNLDTVKKAMNTKIPTETAPVEENKLPEFMQVRNDFSVRLPEYFGGGKLWFRKRLENVVFQGRAWISDNIYWRSPGGTQYMIHSILEWAGAISAESEPTPHITLRNAETQISIDLDISNPLPRNESRIKGTLEVTKASFSQGLGVNREPGQNMANDEASFRDLKAETTQQWLRNLTQSAQSAVEVAET